MHHQQRCAAGLPQVQANTLAQLGSNPLKPLLRATADPTTPSEASEKNGSVVERKTFTFYFAAPKYKEQGHGDEGFPAYQELLCYRFLPCPSVNP